MPREGLLELLLWFWRVPLSNCRLIGIYSVPFLIFVFVFLSQSSFRFASWVAQDNLGVLMSFHCCSRCVNLVYHLVTLWLSWDWRVIFLVETCFLPAFCKIYFYCAVLLRLAYYPIAICIRNMFLLLWRLDNFQDIIFLHDFHIACIFCPHTCPRLFRRLVGLTFVCLCVREWAIIGSGDWKESLCVVPFVSNCTCGLLVL